MSLKLTTQQLVDSFGNAAQGRPGALEKLVNDESLPIAIKSKIARIWKQAKAEYDVYDEDRLRLCKQYGVFNETTGIFDFPAEGAFENFQKDGKELRANPLEFLGEPLKAEETKPRKIGTDKPEGVLNSRDLADLDWMIDPGQDEAAMDEPAPAPAPAAETPKPGLELVPETELPAAA